MQFIGKKAAYALSQNVKVIACIGELLEEREAGKTFDVCFKQMKAFAGDNSSSWVKLIMVDEPTSSEDKIHVSTCCFQTVLQTGRM